MGSTNLNIRIDSEIKKAAEEIFESLGLNMSTAINIFLRSIVREKGFPFDIKLNIPNEETIESFKEGEKLICDKNTKRYSTVTELKEALEK